MQIRGLSCEERVESVESESFVSLVFVPRLEVDSGERPMMDTE